jgi:hypothetical protein
MATGAAWNVDNPLKPWAYFDPHAVRDIPIEWAAWLTDIGSTVSTVTATAQEGLEVVSVTLVSDVAVVRVRKDPDAALIAGGKYWVTCHIVAADGQEDDQTVYLKIAEK